MPITTATQKPKRTPRIYHVSSPTGARLVRAFTPAGAVNHVVGTSHEAHVASQDELLACIGKGVKVEDAGEPVPDQESLPL